ncbi:unnamed protein product [Closterium sp. NIES-64]|nr:unnamed protein product [Closterium sp. NIES-64]CAI5989057.1 unnamed protein product [Closterium sp. NIES-64]
MSLLPKSQHAASQLSKSQHAASVLSQSQHAASHMLVSQHKVTARHVIASSVIAAYERPHFYSRHSRAVSPLHVLTSYGHCCPRHKGIISDQGTTFRGVAVERKLDHQVDWWHVKRTLYNLFCKELQDQVRMAVEVDKASCVEELWLAKVEELKQRLRTKGLVKEEKGTLKASLVKAVCEAMGTIAYVKMTPDEAKWKFPELRKVRRVGGERAAVDVLVGYGEVRPDTTGEMQPIVRDAAVDEADAGATQVVVQWADVEELWQYDIHPVRGARPSSLASSFIVHAHAGP